MTSTHLPQNAAGGPTDWRMPPRVLRMVAILLGVVALSAFALGVINAPQRGRLPGERASGQTGGATAIDATEATPLGQDRIEGPPPPPELTPEEKARLEAEKKAKAEADAAAKAQADAAATNPVPGAVPVPGAAPAPVAPAPAPAAPAAPAAEEPPF